MSETVIDELMDTAAAADPATSGAEQAVTNDAQLVAQAFADHIAGAHLRFVARVDRLLDGYFINTSDALFERAYATSDEQERIRWFGLARTLHQHEVPVRRVFLAVLGRYRQQWLTPAPAVQADPALVALQAQANTYAKSVSARLERVLELVTQQANQQAGADAWPESASLPVHPERVMAAFITAVRSLPVDDADQAALFGWFSRFVLERMGLAYGALNLYLTETR